MIYPYSVIGNADSLKDLVSYDYNLALIAIQQAIGNDSTVAYFQTNRLPEADKEELKNKFKVNFPTANVIDVPYFELDETERILLLIDADIRQKAMEGFKDVYYCLPIDSFNADILRTKGYEVKGNRISW